MIHFGVIANENNNSQPKLAKNSWFYVLNVENI